MKKEIWILNHYATDMFFDEGGRHYWLGKELIKKGYKITIFCANTIHKSDKIVSIKKGMLRCAKKDGLQFVFVKTKMYQGNGLSRVKNMLAYTLNMLRLYRKYGRKYGKPDIIYASSVHPFALYAGLKIAMYYNIKLISEIRDLWPLTLIAFGRLKKDSILARMMFWYEKKIYERTDELIFTMEGGKNYIQDQKWDVGHNGMIDLKKVHHINNGLILNDYYDYRRKFQINDSDLENNNIFKIVYTGSIGEANRLDLIINVAKCLQKKKLPIRFYIWGNGDEKIRLQKRIKQEKVDNVVFKGHVEKKYIPYITSVSDLNILTLKNCNIYQYGLSLNKMFEYIASQKPFLVVGAKCKCRILEENPLCFMLGTSNIQKITEIIVDIYSQNKLKTEISGIDFRTLYKVCDYSKRAEDLIRIIEG